MAIALMVMAPAQVFAQQKLVTVIGIDGVQANDAIREGLREGLKWGGYQESKTFKIVFEKAPPDTSRLAEISKNAVLARSDLIVPIAPSAIQAVIAMTTQIPVVFVGMTDPADPLALSSVVTPANNLTGISSIVPLARQIAPIKQLVPGARKVGVVYNPGDPASVAKIKELQEQMTKSGMALIEASARRPLDVGAAARSLISRVDVLYTFPDPNVVKSYAALVKVANDARVPLVASDSASVRQGAIAAIVITDRDLGVQAGRLASRVLKGAKPNSISAEAARPQLILNTVAAQKQGVQIPSALLQSAGEILR